jgi:hypothetical protein
MSCLTESGACETMLCCNQNLRELFTEELIFLYYILKAQECWKETDALGPFVHLVIHHAVL